MGTTLNTPAWENLIDENIAWLETIPRTLERDHVIDCMKWCRSHKAVIEDTFRPPVSASAVLIPLVDEMNQLLERESDQTESEWSLARQSSLRDCVNIARRELNAALKSEEWASTLRERRLAAGFGMREFAERIGMLPSTYCNIESGREATNLSTRRRIDEGLAAAQKVQP